jgi:hypothetical protein
MTKSLFLFFIDLGMKDNIIVDKTYAFASRIVKLYKFLTHDQKKVCSFQTSPA